MQPILSAVTRFATSSLLVFLAGCATLTGSTTQTIDVTTVDARDRPVRGMTCTLSHAPGTYVFDTPGMEVEIKRSASDLEIECRRGSQIARGTVVSRGESAMAHSFIPGGSIATLVDYATGATYPSPLRLKIGQHLRFESGGEARATVVATVGDPKAPGAAAAVPASASTSTSTSRTTNAQRTTRDTNNSASTQ
jgi:hypothetical protein